MLSLVDTLLKLLKYRQTQTSTEAFAHWALLHVTETGEGKTRKVVHHIHKLNDGTSNYDLKRYNETALTEHQPIGRTDLTFDEMDSLCEELSQNFKLNQATSNRQNWVKIVVDEIQKRGRIVKLGQDVTPTNHELCGGIFMIALSTTSSYGFIGAEEMKSI